jgi:Asp-tRNA(Asn)/Glu-tRNA(Gln) amidotransferase A subunit family amidase
MIDLDLAYMPATELAHRIRRGELSPVEIVRNSLERIAEVNPKLNCFCFVYPDETLEKARAAEAAVRARSDLGPLHGIPIAIKDLTPTKGRRTTLGSYVFENWVPDHDAAIVDRLTRAGAIVVGKTTTPEFAHIEFTESPLWGVTRNPWNLAHTPGGSSGGSGAAVASGCVPLAEGTDMGGSVRIPAAECGIVGLKPSLGRIPLDILPSLFDNISHFGPLARTIDDAALFIAAAQGPDERDIQSLAPALDIPIPVSSDIRGRRFALSLDLGYYTVLDREIEANLQAAVDALREAGAMVEPVELGWTPAVSAAWKDYWRVFMAAYFGEHLDRWRHRMDPAVVDLIEAGNRISAVHYKRLEIVRSEQWRALAAVFEKYDALLSPTMATPAPLASDKIKIANASPFDAAGRFVDRCMTEPFNLVGQCPVLSVPTGFTSSGLPTALSICGRRFDDLGVLTIGAALEAVRPWQAKHPLL